MTRLTGCDTFVVLGSHTEQGGIVFGKNSDRPAGEPQEIVHFPASKHDPGSKLTATYIEIDQVENTLAVILSRPTWLWGAEMGANSEGVVIGNEAVWTKVPDSDEPKALLGMDLVRLGLERGKSAEEALDVITSLLETYGQGGPCSEDGRLTYHNSFLIADPKCAWVLETAGKLWAAQKITDGFRNISNCLTITTSIDKMSDSVKTYAIDNNLWDGQGELNWAETFSSNSCDRLQTGNELLSKLSADKKFSVARMMEVLRDVESGICMKLGGPGSVTASSQVSVLQEEHPCAHWFTGTPDPSVSVFKPFIFTPNVKISHHTVAKNGEREHNLFKLHRDAVSAKPAVLSQLRDMEDKSVAETTSVISKLSPAASLSEFDELFKDVVETEVKFYK
ncbi:secernin [Nesidiocoris tenuis]|uniref:Secernin n=1 Tax=Nesidiocoris tenuis TaxID=355587 RepID=A0ABN7B814_9HEMI|nr:secernin [Nesidiocoris tenuis]